MKTQTIALAGKGGVGKTTICGMLVHYLCAKKQGAVLAVDADANSNLNEVLGMEIETTLGDIREEMAQAEISLDNPIPIGMTKQEFAELKFTEALAEGMVVKKPPIIGNKPRITSITAMVRPT